MRCPHLDELPPPPPGKSGWPWTEESCQLPDIRPDGRPWPRVSVITPSYNQGQYLEETIRAVLLQGYPELEYLIIDGGSTDESVDLIRKYQPWLYYWVSEPDRGQSHAVNKGWAKATGDILAYINSDDCYLNGAIAGAVEGYTANPQAGMIYGTANVIDEAGHKIRTWEAKPFDLKVMLTAGSVVPQPAAFFSRNVLNKVGYLDESWHMIMDYELCIRIGLQFPAICLPATLAKFRDHPQGKTNLHFEATATELIQFLAAFSPRQVPSQEMRSIRSETLSRIHFEWALAYLAPGRQEPSKALKQLLKSVLLNPLFAIHRPLVIAYILKEVFLRSLLSIGMCFPVQVDPRHGVR